VETKAGRFFSFPQPWKQKLAVFFHFHSRGNESWPLFFNSTAVEIKPVGFFLVPDRNPYQPADFDQPCEQK
jgi:hypothetical protein